MTTSTSDGADEIGTLEPMAPDECMELVAQVTIGRIAVAQDDGPPLVMPVNYVLEGQIIVFRSDPGTKLRALRDREVSFQVDFIDQYHRTGWSVLIHGHAVAIAAGGTGRDVDSWVRVDEPHVVQITPSRISGRRIKLPTFVRDSRGYL